MSEAMQYPYLLSTYFLFLENIFITWRMCMTGPACSLRNSPVSLFLASGAPPRGNTRVPQQRTEEEEVRREGCGESAAEK